MTSPVKRLRSPSACGLASLAVAVLVFAFASCEADVPDYPRGSPGTEVLPLTQDNHPGWHVPDCSLCHGQAHDNDFSWGKCSVCHGENGAPQLTESHPGWGSGGCTGCHASLENHAEGLEPDNCGGCHGDNNGAVEPTDSVDVPTVDASHFGWQRADCATCHSGPGTHGGQYEGYACGGCHGSNGGPLRPENHWTTHCNDCHVDGPAPWNACTHQDYPLFAPRACRLCHH